MFTHLSFIVFFFFVVTASCWFITQALIARHNHLAHGAKLNKKKLYLSMVLMFTGCLLLLLSFFVQFGTPVYQNSEMGMPSVGASCPLELNSSSKDSLTS